MSKKLKLKDCAHCGSDCMDICVTKWLPKPYEVACPECGCATKSYKRLEDAVRAWDKGRIREWKYVRREY